MTKNSVVKILIAGLVGGFIGNGVMGALFSSPPIQSILYNPEWQSQLFIEITPKRNIPVSVAALSYWALSTLGFSAFSCPRYRKDMAEKRTLLGINNMVDVLAVSGMVYLQHVAWRAAHPEYSWTHYLDIGVLIDGDALAQLMLDYNIGVTTIATYELKRVDSDYFTEE